MNKYEAKVMYEQKVKPLLDGWNARDAAELVFRKPELKNLLSRDELQQLVDYYESVIISISKQVDDNGRSLSEMEKGLSNIGESLDGTIRVLGGKSH